MHKVDVPMYLPKTLYVCIPKLLSAIKNHDFFFFLIRWRILPHLYSTLYTNEE